MCFGHSVWGKLSNGTGGNVTLMTIDRTAAEVDRIGAFHELLSTLAGALDVRDVFQQVSSVVGRIIYHDEANLALLTQDGSRFRLYASTRGGEPELLCLDRKSTRLNSSHRC